MACQYMLPYFVLLIPYGVTGLKDFRDIIADRVGKRIGKSSGKK